MSARSLLAFVAVLGPAPARFAWRYARRRLADVDENRAVWQGWDWSAAGEEWSASWGGTGPLWFATLLPRIHAFVPTATILEIAPGYGRWTQFLKDVCDRLVIVDLAQNCIDHCRERFADASNIEFHVNDGRSLEMIDDGSIDFVFSFDSLVHAEADILATYLSQLERKLAPDGVGFIHHSNAGRYRPLTAITRRTPEPLRRRLVDAGLLIDVYAWRAESVTASRFAAACEGAGLSCVSQEEINWEHGPWLTDALSVFTPRGSRWDRQQSVLRNRRFRSEALRAARLYGDAPQPLGDRPAGTS